jgi:hypothetical protein
VIPERLVQAYASAPQLANEESPFGLGTFDQFGFTFPDSPFYRQVVRDKDQGSSMSELPSMRQLRIASSLSVTCLELRLVP